MKFNQIFIFIAIALFAFSSCSKEETVAPKEVEIDNQFQTMDPIGDDEDDEYIVIKPKPKSQQTGLPLFGADVEVYNSTYGVVGTVDASGNLDLVLPEFGVYSYKVTLNNNVLIVKAVDVQVDGLEIIDYL